MELRSLGRSGLKVAPLGFGGNVFGWTVSEPDAYELLDAFVDADLNLVDTADVYSRWVLGHQGGESETIIGRWLQKTGKRDRIVLATKVGKEMAPGRSGLSKAYIRQAVEESLRRLQTDHIDLYQSHDDDTSTPFEETLGAYAELIQAGKVRAIGASNHDASRLAEALDTSRRLGLPRYESLQPLYNLYDRAAYEAELAPLCQREGLGVITFYPLAMGFLTGKYRSEADLQKSRRGEAARRYMNERGTRVLAALDTVADQHRATQAQVALAWQLSQPGVTAPLASATTLEQLQDLIGAVRLQLTPADLELLGTASA